MKAFVFPGQGAQFVGMGKDLYDTNPLAKQLFDEADRILDMGFSDDIKTIAAKLPKTCQTIMFSATMPEKIHLLRRRCQSRHDSRSLLGELSAPRRRRSPELRTGLRLAAARANAMQKPRRPTPVRWLPLRRPARRKR